ncbi:MAG: DUF721 domain-containing protein [Aridibacter sp.]
MEDLFRTLPKLLKELEDSDEIREAVVFAAWRRVAGKSLCEHSVPFRLDEKHLIVAVKDKMWKRHLEKELAGQMIFKLNSILGQPAVTFIEFRVDEETVLRETKQTRTIKISDEKYKEIALNEVSPNLRHHADAIKDDNLRYQFLLAAGSCLARKKGNEK